MKTIPLTKPIEAHGEKLTELKFREISELEAGDLRGIKITIGEDGLTFTTDAILTVASRLCGVPPSSLDKLSGGDLMKLSEMVLPLLASSRRTGTT